MFFRRSNKKSHFTDEELIHQYQLTRETVYIGELYQRYTHLVFGMCLKYFKEEEDSKDAVMQIFEKLLQVLKTQEVTKFQHWLHVLVLLTFLNYLPYSKHIHLLGALPNIFARNRSERRMDLPRLDLERMVLRPGARMAGVPHTPGTREYLTCERGTVELAVAGEKYTLLEGDVVSFRGDQRHAYHNPGSSTSVA